jgi:hypothetical protein
MQWPNNDGEDPLKLSTLVRTNGLQSLKDPNNYSTASTKEVEGDKLGGEESSEPLIRCPAELYKKGDDLPSPGSTLTSINSHQPIAQWRA